MVETGGISWILLEGRSSPDFLVQPVMGSMGCRSGCPPGTLLAEETGLDAWAYFLQRTHLPRRRSVEVCGRREPKLWKQQLKHSKNMWIYNDAMWVTQFHKPFPQFHHKFRWYGNHSLSWVVYGIVLPTLFAPRWPRVSRSACGFCVPALFHAGEQTARRHCSGRWFGLCVGAKIQKTYGIPVTHL